MTRTRHVLTVALTALLLTLVLATTALAVPDFGPGNSQAGPHDGNAKCHPPGQTVDTPGCK